MKSQPLEIPKQIDQERFLDVKQLRKVLKVSKTTLYSLISRKKNPLPSVRIGKLRRFPIDKIRWWMDNLEQ
jgi:excisionase family DNA binding protein